ncbi:MAG: tetratricopeptide repeat protein, partial [Acidobacteriaceae bacterium]
TLVAEASALVEVKRFPEAIERAREALIIAPSDSRPFCEWSRALYGQGKYAEAATKAEEAIGLDPQSPRGFRLKTAALGSLARQGTKRDRSRIGAESLTAAREALRLTPNDPAALVGLAQALSLVNDNREANAVVKRAIRRAPNSVATWVAASVVALASKNWNEAISASQRALAIDPGNQAALNNLGVALSKSGKRREGAEVLVRAAQADPQSATVRRNLSKAGLRWMRLAILIVLLPIAVFIHGGIALYLVFSIGSNILLSRSRQLALRLERWAAPVAMFFAKRPKDSSP